MPRKPATKAAAAAVIDSSIIVWEWEKGNGWQKYEKEDCEALEKAFNSKKNIVRLRFTFAQDVDYEVNFAESTQKNLASSKVRKIRRSSTHSTWKGDSKVPDPPELTADEIKAQAALGTQSMRNWPKADFGPAVNGNPHAKRCFQQMLANERRYAGEWAVFYHSYNNPALLYEIQAAIAAVLFRFKSTYAALPRLTRGCFSELPDAPTILAQFPKWKDRDHNPKFKSVGICATVNLLAPDSEAPATTCFLMGYAASTIPRTVIDGMLTTCGVTAAQASKLTQDLIRLAEKHGLHVGSFGGRPSSSGHAGHLLQIFIRRHLVDKYAYAALPFGVLDNPRHPLGAFLQTAGPMLGQARICVHPSAFMRATKVRCFTYSADEHFHRARPAFQEEVVALLEPILGGRVERERAARGIFGGVLPAWFEAEDQRKYAVTPPRPPAAGGRVGGAAAAAAASPAPAPAAAAAAPVPDPAAAAGGGSAAAAAAPPGPLTRSSSKSGLGAVPADPAAAPAPAAAATTTTTTTTGGGAGAGDAAGARPTRAGSKRSLDMGGGPASPTAAGGGDSKRRRS